MKKIKCPNCNKKIISVTAILLRDGYYEAQCLNCGFVFHVDKYGKIIYPTKGNS
jgi:transcription elongation factor Elf1